MDGWMDVTDGRGLNGWCSIVDVAGVGRMHGFLAHLDALEDRHRGYPKVVQERLLRDRSVREEVKEPAHDWKRRTELLSSRP
uniref:Uncharacterized protein n=1 Tax=Peronospora matthiolae TaxID=2874970 RepID=A0AAV1T7N9_9STRA